MEEMKLTPIQQFYSGKNIFITGSTGFLGTILLEKLLRSCPNISKIYVLVRGRKGKDSTTRVKEMLNDIHFQRLKIEQSNFEDKVLAIDGDCTLPNLGISLQNSELLKKEVNIIFHMAATVNLAGKLKSAVLVNIKATRDIINLAHEMSNLKVIMHVSTAYSNCIHTVIEEKIYPPAFNSTAIIAMAESIPETSLDKISNVLLGEYPNSYTYTKQIAEGVIEEFGFDLPVGLYRPGVVISTYKEPIKSWTNNVYSITGLVAYGGLGILRTIYGDVHCKSNVVPVDMCTNSLIAAAWNIATSFEEANMKGKIDIPVYHYESNSVNPVTWRSVLDKSFSYGMETPSLKTVWYHNWKCHNNWYLYKIRAFLVHILPALIVDMMFFCIGIKPKITKMYLKLHKLVEVLAPFSVREWTYKSNNIKKVIDKMSDKDRDIFYADLQQVDWDEFLRTYFYGIRLYVFKDPAETIPEAKRKWKRLYWAHQFLTVVVGMILFCALWYLVKKLILNFL